MSEIENPIAIAGIRPELAASLDSATLRSLSNASLRVLQRLHHPDVGGNQRASSRVNDAGLDLEDEVMFEELRGEYGELARFGELVVNARNAVAVRSHESAAVGVMISYLIANVNPVHRMSWRPCTLSLLEPEVTYREISSVSREITAQNKRVSSERAMEEFEREEAKYEVDESEIDAVLADSELTFKIVTDNFTRERDDWVREEFARRYPRLWELGDSMDDEEFTEWQEADPVGAEHGNKFHEISLDYQKRPEIVERLRKLIRAELESQREREVDSDSDDDFDDQDEFDFVEAEALAAVANEQSLRNLSSGEIAMARTGFVGEKYVALRSNSLLQLRMNERGGLWVRKADEQENALAGVTLIGVLHLETPDERNPTPWNEYSTRKEELISIYEEDLDNDGAKKQSTKEDTQIAALRAVSEKVLQRAFAGRRSAVFSASFDDCVEWTRKDTETLNGARVHGMTPCLVALVQRDTGPALEVLGEVVHLEE